MKKIQFINCHAATGGEREGSGIWLPVQGTDRPLQATEKGSRTAMFKGPRRAQAESALHLLFCSRTELDHIQHGCEEALKQFGVQLIQRNSFVPLKKYAALAISTYIIKQVTRSLHASLHLKKGNSWQAGHPYLLQAPRTKVFTFKPQSLVFVAGDFKEAQVQNPTITEFELPLEKPIPKHLSLLILEHGSSYWERKALSGNHQPHGWHSHMVAAKDTFWDQNAYSSH